MLRTQSLRACLGVAAVAFGGLILVPALTQGQGKGSNAYPDNVNVVNTPNVTITNGATNPVVVKTQGTHTGRPASEHVTLSSWAVIGQSEFLQRVSSSGGDETPFVVPADKVLVVTDYSWEVEGGRAGDVQLVDLRLISQGHRYFVHHSAATYGGTGLTGTSVSIAGGIVFGPGTELEFGFRGAHTGTRVSVHGYLAPIE